MALERTFSILKPDATKRNITGAVNAIIEKGGLRIVAQKRVRITREQAETFYARTRCTARTRRRRPRSKSRNSSPAMRSSAKRFPAKCAAVRRRKRL